MSNGTEFIINWDAVTAGATVIYVILTGVLFYIMHQQLQVALKSSIRETKPILDFGVVSKIEDIDKRSPYELEPNMLLYLKNISRNFAKNISVNIVLKEDGEEPFILQKLKLPYLNPQEISAHHFGHELTDYFKKKNYFIQREGYFETNKYGDSEYLESIPKGKKPNAYWLQPKNNFTVKLLLYITEQTTDEKTYLKDEYQLNYNVGNPYIHWKPVMNIGRHHSRGKWEIFRNTN
jgi:hypothetical protein